MSEMIPVTGFEGSLARDPNSNAVVNVDHSAFEAFRQRRLVEVENERKMRSMQEKIDRLEFMLNKLLVNTTKLEGLETKE